MSKHELEAIDRKQHISALQSIADRWTGIIEQARLGDQLDGDIDAIRDAANYLKRLTTPSAETPRGEVTDAMRAKVHDHLPVHWNDEMRKTVFAALEAALSLPKPADVGKADVDEAGIDSSNSQGLTMGLTVTALNDILHLDEKTTSLAMARSIAQNALIHLAEVKS